MLPISTCVLIAYIGFLIGYYLKAFLGREKHSFELAHQQASASHRVYKLLETFFKNHNVELPKENSEFTSTLLKMINEILFEQVKDRDRIKHLVEYIQQAIPDAELWRNNDFKEIYNHLNRTLNSYKDQ